MKLEDVSLSGKHGNCGRQNTCVAQVPRAFSSYLSWVVWEPKSIVHLRYLAAERIETLKGYGVKPGQVHYVMGFD